MHALKFKLDQYVLQHNELSIPLLSLHGHFHVFDIHGLTKSVVYNLEFGAWVVFPQLADT